jgi:neutral ceramidase
MEQRVATCRAGLARVCITPRSLPCDMAGYFHRRMAESVSRDLYATVFAFEKDDETIVLVSADLLAMTDEVCQPAFAKAHERWGIPLNNMIAFATHTHTAPEIRRDSCIPVVEEYVRMLPGLIEQAVTSALENMSEAVLCFAETNAPGLAHNRLSRCADGSEIFGGKSSTSKVIGAAGPTDDSVQVLAIYTPEKTLRGLMINFACHTDTSGGGKATAIDSDWPGEMTSYLQGILGADLPVLFMQGTSGDINTRDTRTTQPHWLEGGRSKLARGVAGAALYALQIALPLQEIVIRSARQALELPYYVRDQVLFDLLEKLKQKGEAATYFEQTLIKRIEGWQNDGKVDHVEVTALRIGDLAIAAMPGEIFVNWSLEIKRYSPAKHTMIAELASSHDGMTSYKATSDQSLRGARGIGAYGALPTLSQRHCPASGQMMTDSAIELLHKLYEC